MSLVRWMRKNHTKIMVIVLVIIMVGFVIGASLPIIINQFVNRIAAAKAFATYGDNQKITENDRRQAQKDLNILQELYANEYLNIIRTPIEGIPNFKTILVSQMIFPDQRAPVISNGMKQSVMRGQLQVTAAQIDDFFIQLNKTSPDIYWLLLNAEAKNAGITIAPNNAELILKELIPYFTQGRPASQLINSLVSEHRISREQIYNAFAKLLAIVNYVDMVTTSEDVTIDQIRARLGRSGEKITAEFIKLEANTESAKLPQPTDREIDEQFQKYKAFAPSNISDENPFGFGYKLPASVEIEYLIVELKDIEKLIDKPSDEELETYYQYNIDRFTYPEPTDPGNPESEKITKTWEYAEVMEQIRAGLIQERASRRANMIMNDAIVITEAKLIALDTEKPTSETYKAIAVPFGEASLKLREKHDINILTGITGRLNRTELARDPVLGSLGVKSQNSQGIALEKIAFSLEGLAETKLGRFDIATPKMFQNIGPMNNAQNTLVGIVRVVAVHPSAEPENIDTAFSNKSPVIEIPDPVLNNMFNVKDEVIKDVKALKAMQIAKDAADKLGALIEEKGWDDAIKAFNEAKKDEEDPVIGTVRLETQSNKTRISLLDKKVIEISTAGNPVAGIYRFIIDNAMLTEKLVSFLPNGKDEAEDIRKIFAFEPQISYYIVRSIQKQPVTEDDYYKNKNDIALRVDISRSMSLAFVHLSPENLLKRTNFERAKQKEEEPVTGDENNQKENGAN
ncbi:MAG: hypothetical protein FVQ79_11690 [Planctomycetes bacterium]|nr:hypothetical protein [Planctomycetota bacterium]